MTSRELYTAVRQEYSSHSELSEWLSFRDLWLALCEKDSFESEGHILNPDTEESSSEKILADAKALCEGYPLQYYLGYAEFAGRRFGVRENVLIPREDTAVVCHLASKYLGDGVLFDFCTGSGIIAITSLLENPNSRAKALDISPDAVSLTLENARLHGVNKRLSIALCDLFSPDAKRLLLEARPNVITANPPYIRSSDMRSLPENVKREPSEALDGGEDGMKFYRYLTELCAPLVREGSRLIFEIGFDEGNEVCFIARSLELEAEVYPDENGLPRAVLIENCC